MTEHYELARKPVRPINDSGGTRNRFSTRPSSKPVPLVPRVKNGLALFSIEQVQFEYREPIIQRMVSLERTGRTRREKKKKEREREGERQKEGELSGNCNRSPWKRVLAS